MMLISGQLTLAPPVRLPLIPEQLIGLEPLDRGRFYNALDLDSWQRGCAEEAIRILAAGTYGRGGPQ